MKNKILADLHGKKAKFMSINQARELGKVFETAQHNKHPGIASYAYFSLLELKSWWIEYECYEILADLHRLEKWHNVDLDVSRIVLKE